LTIKKRGRPRKEAKEEEPMIDSGRVKKDKDVTANKKLKKSNSVGLEAAANEDTFQSLFIDSKEESQIKKRGRPKKNSINPLN
jgi:CRISPR/Cas system-associated endonuclease Cas1